MGKTGLGIDVGVTSLKVVEGRESSGGFEVTRALSIPLDSSHDIAGALKSALSNWKPKVKSAIVGVTGRDVMMRYSQVPPVPDWQLREMMDFEVQEIRSQSGEDLSTDYNLLPISSEYSDEDIVLMTMAKENYLSPIREALKSVGLSLKHFTPNSIALYNVFAKLGPDVQGVTMLLNLGSQHSDIAILKDHDLIFARNISIGGNVFDDALVKQFNVSNSKAESLKIQMGDVRPREQRREQTPQQAKVSTAMEGAAGQIFSMIRSTMMLAKTQLKLQELALNQVFISGGTAALKGLPEYLANSLSVHVERFDGFESVELSCEDDIEAYSLAATPALGLAMGGVYSDIYSLEVLNDVERKKRQFQGSTIFSILAIVLVVLFLGFDAYKAKDNYGKAEVAFAKVSAQRAKLARDEKRFEDRIQERTELGSKVSQLEAFREGTLGLLAVKRAVEKHLPEEFWIRIIRIDSETPISTEGVGKRPAIFVEGAGRESKLGVSLVSIFRDFSQRIEGEPGIEAVRPLGGVGTGSFDFRLVVFPARFEGLEPILDSTETEG